MRLFLLLSLLALGMPAEAQVWINEVHHSNAGRDVGEGVEIAGPAGTRLGGYRVWTYSGSGDPYTAAPGGSLSVALSGTIDDEGGGLGAVWLPAPGLRGGCQGLALTRPGGALVQFLSTGGCRFNALSGPVFDLAAARGASDAAHPDSLAWSAAIQGPHPASGGHPRRVQEWSTLPPGHSLQRTGAGRTASDFAWAGPLPATPGRLGDYQAPAGRPNPVSGWTAGLPVPQGLLAPLADGDCRSCGDARPEPVLPDLSGGALLDALARDFTPAVTFPYDRSRDSLFAAVYLERAGDADSLRCVYSGVAVALDPALDPTTAAYNASPRLSTEHLWPQNRGATSGTAAYADLHHLVPAQQSINASRGDDPFGEVADSDADRWWGPEGGTRATPPPLSVRDSYSEKLNGGAASRMEPREGVEGDVARALFYVYAVYGPAGADQLDEAFWTTQRSTLLAWHAADAADDAERARSSRIAGWQGTQNPFVLDATLAGRAFGTPTAADDAAPTSPVALSLLAPNPVRGGIVRATLSLAAPAIVRVVVTDALGRTVAVAFDGLATGSLGIEVDADRLAPGVYSLRISGADGPAVARRFTVTR